MVPQIQTTSDSTFKKRSELKALVIGGNSGSPDHLEKLIQSLAHDTPPVIVACSTITQFLEAYIKKLKSKAPCSLGIAKSGEALSMGKIYFLPSGHHGKIVNTMIGTSLKVEPGPPVSFQTPSANVLFKSAAECLGAGVYGVLLGGFGGDGVEGLAAIQAKGGMTIAQNPNQASFPFAPQQAIQQGIPEEVLDVEAISHHLMNYRNKSVY